ncbi:MAG: alpha/beta fold hydrolase [Thermonemataceae bacterium]
MWMYILLTLVLLTVIVGVVDYQRFIRERRKVAESFLTIDTPYGKVQYLDMGPKEAPVILFSTGGGAGIDLIAMFDWLLEAGYRLIAVNRPGYYDLPVDAVDSIEEHADIYHAVVKALGISEVNVFGVSMGGLSALYYAAAYPVRAMILWSPLTGEYHPKKEALDTPFAKLFLSDKAKDLISWLMTRSVHIYPKALVKSLLKAEANLDKPSINKIVYYLVSNPAEKRRLIQFVHALAPMRKIYPGMMDELEKSSKEQPIAWHKITMPVLTYASPLDKDVSQDHFERLEENLANGTCKYVEAGGHFVWWGPEGEEVTQGTLQFFNRYNSK